MPAYFVVEVNEVTEPETYMEYIQKVAAVVQRHGGRYLVRGEPVVPVAGNWEPERLVIIEFENLETLQACFSSPEYLEIAPLRNRSVIGRALAVESGK